MSTWDVLQFEGACHGQCAREHTWTFPPWCHAENAVFRLEWRFHSYVLRFTVGQLIQMFASVQLVPAWPVTNPPGGTVPSHQGAVCWDEMFSGPRWDCPFLLTCRTATHGTDMAWTGHGHGMTLLEIPAVFSASCCQQSQCTSLALYLSILHFSFCFKGSIVWASGYRFLLPVII